mgnify:CR=1 FL=1
MNMKNFQTSSSKQTIQYLKSISKISNFGYFLSFIMLSIILTLSFCTVLSTSKTSKTTSSNKILTKDNPISNPLSSPTIIIDPGHGGRDPGKVGVTGTLEKDINLQIALILKSLLEAQDINVIMTRDEDKELTTNTDNRKISDMKERIKLIQESNSTLVISIHQNSYTSSDVYGAQCFYNTNSPEGEQLAAIIQNQIITSTNQTKIREIKSNNDYYLLKHSPIPTVIVECGFLSNPEEEKLLLTVEYQHKMAWAIHLGILQYINIKNN